MKYNSIICDIATFRHPLLFNVPGEGDPSKIYVPCLLSISQNPQATIQCYNNLMTGSVVSTQYTSVTDRQTDGRTDTARRTTAYTALCICVAQKNMENIVEIKKY